VVQASHQQHFQTPSLGVLLTNSA
ncbi:uncharacterized protein METZ01_LOCUS258447, partial [marine metagenome]